MILRNFRRIGLILAGIPTLAGTAWSAPADKPADTGDFTFKTCHAHWNQRELTLENAHFKRTWRIDEGLLTATSFRDLDADCEWLAKPSNRPAPFPGGTPPRGTRRITAKACAGQASPVEEESLVLEMTASGSPAYRYRFQVFPAASGVLMRFGTDAGEASKPAAGDGDGLGEATGIEADPTSRKVTAAGDSLEDLRLAPQHLLFTQVELQDVTDSHNELVFENEWLLSPSEKTLRLSGNLFHIEDPLTGAGLVFLKQAPLPHARPVKSLWDAEVTPGRRGLRFAGQGYPFVLLAYSGGRNGRIKALHTYQRQLRRYRPGRDGMFLSNTWGDRSRDARINEEFMLREIQAGARLGVDVIQIDDGWQKGRSANSASGKGAWNGYWAVDPEFWQPDPKRFPRGLAPVVEAARAEGMKFGLWYGPDSSNGAANWRRDAARIIELHRSHGIDYFKLDSLKADNLAAERNLRKLWDEVLDASDGKVVFDLDVTAEVRPGYFGAMDVGPIFVENRYTDFHNYWPHQTLRNLWQLSQYVDPLGLRMEFLNNTRNAGKYAGDPLAPSLYQPDCLFATVMFSSPLGWFETSNLPKDYIASVSQLVTVWKREREKLFSGITYPIGHAPDGANWTGFASVGTDGESGYALVFRELAESPDWKSAMSLFGKGPHRATSLAGSGSMELTDGMLSVRIPETLGYLWAKIEPAE